MTGPAVLLAVVAGSALMGLGWLIDQPGLALVGALAAIPGMVWVSDWLDRRDPIR